VPIQQSLRVARIAAGITHQDLAAAIGLVPTAIGNYEAGRRNLTPEKLERWRTALKRLMANRTAQIAQSLITL
jgi:transcriptional regulator with XRE-family HTH domain